MITDTAHRPWPLPSRPWVLTMQWHDLLFMHWPVSPARLRAHIPSALSLDTFDGTAWIGVVPFLMKHVHPRYLPTVPRLSAFPELNLRTYVTVGEKPGVWFFSLDAASPLAVILARSLFHLPYFHARMVTERAGDWVYYTSLRTHRGAVPGEFHGRYRPVGTDDLAATGALEQWLTERYCLYSADRQGRVWAGDIHHRRWPLQPAEAEIRVNTVTHLLDFDLPATPPLLHFSRRLDVVAWAIEQVA